MVKKITSVREGEWIGLVYGDGNGYDEILPLGCPTAEEYADLCDQENENYHHLCGAHERLVSILEAHVAPPERVAVMREIAEAGGLWRLS